MKKAKKLFVAVMLVMTAFMMSGCALFDLFNSVGPKNKWMEYDYTYTVDDGNGNKNSYLFEVYMYYTDNDVALPDTMQDLVYRGFDENGEEKDITTRTLPAGLTIVVNPSTNVTDTSILQQVLGITANNSYVVVPIKNGTSLDMTAEETGKGQALSGLKMGYTTWLTISLCTTEMDSVGKNGPSCMKEGSPTKPIAAANFNWKKILAAIAIDKLMEIQ